jgi:hypothetical protein
VSRDFLRFVFQGQSWTNDFTFLVLCGISVEDLLSSSEHNEHAQTPAEQLDDEDDTRGRSTVRVQVLCALAAAKTVIYSSWLDACSKHQRAVSFQPHEAPITPSLPPKWHRHMIQPLFSRCWVLPIACTAQAMQLLVAGGASIQSQVSSPSKNSYSTATIVVVSREVYKSDGEHSSTVTLLASLGFPVLFITFFEDWAQHAAPPPHARHELPEAKAAAAKATKSDSVSTSAPEISIDHAQKSADHAVSSVFRHTDKKHAKCSICRGTSILGSTGMHIVDIVDTSTSGHLACFQWLCGDASPTLPTVQVISCLL